MTKLIFDPAANKFRVAFAKPDEPTKPKSNIVGEDDGIPYADTVGNINSVCSSMNYLYSRGYFKVLRCRECGQFYIFRKDEEEWYENAGLEQPKRCKGCRKAAKERLRRKQAEAAMENKEREEAEDLTSELEWGLELKEDELDD